MMPLYVYALLPIGTNLPADVRGFHDAPLEMVGAGDLAAVVACHDGTQPGPTPENVEAHHSVVTQLRELGPALPVRFGTVLPDSEQVGEAIGERHDSLLEDMHRLDGKVEFGISVLWGSALDGISLPARTRVKSAGSGSEYMRKRLAEYRQENQLRELAEALGWEIETTLERFVESVKVSVLPTMNMPVRAKFLVDTAQVHAFESRYSELHTAHPQHKFFLVGPWPPYSFVFAAEEINPGMVGAKEEVEE